MQRLTILCVALALGACHDRRGSSATRFDTFVTGLIQDQTSETGAPVPLDGRRFTFPTDPDAFTAVLPLDNGPIVEQ